jgi:hypothetical protein
MDDRRRGLFDDRGKRLGRTVKQGNVFVLGGTGGTSAGNKNGQAAEKRCKNLQID